MAQILEATGDDELAPEFDADILSLTHEEAVGCLRALVGGGWVSAAAMNLTMRVQRRALAAQKDVG